MFIPTTKGHTVRSILLVLATSLALLTATGTAVARPAPLDPPPPVATASSGLGAVTAPSRADGVQTSDGIAAAVVVLIGAGALSAGAAGGFAAARHGQRPGLVRLG